MSKIYPNITALIGKTPLVNFDRLNKNHQGKATLLVKLEVFNPAGSVKDRIALRMITEAQKQGKLLEGGLIIEPTSGNTGIGLAAVSAAKGFRLILTMPEDISSECQKILKAYGAEVILTPAQDGMQGAITKANQLILENPTAFMPSQFDNPNNPKVHFETTGPEIFHDTEGQVDIVVIGVKTGGSITGIGEYLKGKNPSVKIVAVQASDSPLLSGEETKPHHHQGFIPSILNRQIIDEIISVSTQEALDTARDCAKTEGFLTGISGAAALFAGLSLSKRSENSGKTIVVLIPDGGERYLSTLLYEV